MVELSVKNTKKMSNLPPGVNIGDSDAPWNQTHPEPCDIDCRCEDCGWSGTLEETEAGSGASCPECNSEVIKNG